MSVRSWFLKRKQPLVADPLFAQASSNSILKKLQLIDVVHRNETASGGFMDLYNDLAPVWKPDLDPSIQMAYAYARRMATYGLFFQGVDKQEDIEKSEKVFRSLQATTGQTIDFQEAASAQANELLSEYLPDFSYSHLLIIAAYARQGMDVSDVAMVPGVNIEIHETNPPYSIESCFAVTNILVKKGFEFQPGIK